MSTHTDVDPHGHSAAFRGGSLLHPRTWPVRQLVWFLVPPLGTFVGFLGAWLLVSYVVLVPSRRFLLPPPQDVFRVGFLNASNLAELLRALASTTVVALVGLAVAAVAGLALAILMSQAPWIEQSLYPYAVALQTIPILALVPLIGFWFGFDFRSRVLVCILIAIFPIITNGLFGIRSVDRGLYDLFFLHGAGRLMRLWKLELPAAVPAVITGLRISAGLSVIGAIVGDFFFRQGEPGVGRLIDLYRTRLESEKMIAAIFFSSLLGLAVFWIFGLIEKLAVGSWHESGRIRLRGD
jgi:NitT/TauT family transport system permease protein